MKKTVCLLFVLTAAAAAEMSIPGGIPVWVRLSNELPRASASGQTVELAVIEEVRFQGNLAIAVGARAIGAVIQTAGKDPKPELSIHRVQAVDGTWINLRNGAGKNAPASLLRTDQPDGRAADPNLLLPRGATFGLFVDEKKAVAMIPAEQPKQDPGLLQWLGGKAEMSSIWSQAFYKIGTGLLILLGLLHQRRMNRQA